MDRIFIGVLEYTDTYSQSQSENLPKVYRNNVRIYPISHKKAISLKESRLFCISQLYQNEDYILFCKSCILPQRWDITLINDVSHNTKCILSMPICKSKISIYPTIKSIRENDSIEIKNEKFYVQHRQHPIESVIFCNDFVFGTKNIVMISLSDDTEFGVSCNLFKHYVSILIPKLICVRISHPVGVTSISICKVENNTKLKFSKHIGLDFAKKHVSSNSKCGLTSKPSLEEYIYKYGSKWQAEIVLEESSSK